LSPEGIWIDLGIYDPVLFANDSGLQDVGISDPDLYDAEAGWVTSIGTSVCTKTETGEGDVALCPN